MSSTVPTAAAIALKVGEGEALWFLDSLAVIKAGGQETRGSVAVIEFTAPCGSGSPLHVHHNEDEWFWVLEGELTFWVGGEVIAAPAGSFVYGPRDVPHTFVVASEQARFLLVTEPGAFSEFVRALSVPAESRSIPPQAIPRPDPERMTAVAAEYGLEILGPPGIPD